MNRDGKGLQVPANDEILIFCLDNPRYALYVSDVVRVIAAVEVSPLPEAPEIIMGIINYHGDVIPVIDMRKRFHLDLREIGPEDKFIIVQTSKRLVALVADSVSGLHKLKPGQLENGGQAFPLSDLLSGVAKTEDNLILLTDLERFLSLNEEKMLDEAIAAVKK